MRAQVRAIVSAAWLAAGAASAAHAADGSALADRFTARTTAMTPRDAALRVDVRTWSDDDARAAVVETLSTSSDADLPKALQALPTVGYVWTGDSPVGYALKYAHRSSTPTGERVTFVTDKRLGAYERKSWALDAPAAQKTAAYSVVELYLDGAGKGDGTLSLAAEPKIDAEQKIVTLATDAGAAHVLADAKHEQKPDSMKVR
jgi:hypothetical protein